MNGRDTLTGLQTADSDSGAAPSVSSSSVMMVGSRVVKVEGSREKDERERDRSQSRLTKYHLDIETRPNAQSQRELGKAGLAKANSPQAYHHLPLHR